MSENGGDRELVLGTKHLLAIFFVGALLCGVFFAVGYVVGGNSAKSTLASDATPATVAEGKREQPQPDSGASSAGSTSAPPPSAYSPSDAGGQIPAAEPRMAYNPAAAGSAPPATAAAMPPAPAPVTAAPPTTAGSSKTAPAPTAAGMPVSVPEKGASYVQVTAVARPNADDTVRSLREAKLPAILAESSKPELFRVLVGPYRAPLALADAKRKLTELGFGNVVVFKP